MYQLSIARLLAPIGVAAVGVGLLLLGLVVVGATVATIAIAFSLLNLLAVLVDAAVGKPETDVRRARQRWFARHPFVALFVLKHRWAMRALLAVSPRSWRDA